MFYTHAKNAKLSPKERNLFAFTELDVAGWVNNINHYNAPDGEISCEEYLEYVLQPLEEDAREWSYRSTKEFFDGIDYYTQAELQE